MHPETDTESEEDIENDLEYQTLVSSSSDDPVAAQALAGQLYEVYWQAKRRWRTFTGRPTRRRRFTRRGKSSNRGPRYLCSTCSTCRSR
eukprot:290613-Prorocentrum_lima.AAC.1